MSELTQSAAWQRLQQQQQRMQAFSLADAFAADHGRADQYALSAAGIYLDFSKNHIDPTVLDALLELASHCGVKQGIERLHNGDIVNPSEERPALHWLLRAQAGDTAGDLGTLLPEIGEVKQHLDDVSQQVITGRLRGYTGKPFTDVVNIGIGGSDLGPAMAYQALRNEQLTGIRCHFVANMCAHDLLETLQDLDPHSTLFIVASKSFTTLETLQNANTAKQWLLDSLQDENAVASHFFAVSSKPELARNWGIREEFVFPFRDWVGGRYSVWSAIGLPLCIGLGYPAFEQFLAGARAMDRHFFSSDFPVNMPVLLALIGIWYSNFWHCDQHAIIPYDNRLRRFPAYLQQLMMESNGKSCTINGQRTDYTTCPAIWGEPGSNAQHSFFQLLHQGSPMIPVDFIAVCDGGHPHHEHQQWLLSNCLAQSRTLMLGQQLAGDDPLAAHKFMPGNRPSNTLLLQQLTPATLGALIALYEHKTYVQSLIWNINAFDQWGVELGKTISRQIKSVMDGTGESRTMDSSTMALLARIRSED